jgi:hypothetical protein
LAGLVEAALLQASVAGDVGGDLEFLAVRVGLDAGVETRGGAAKLNVERACHEEGG